MRLNVFMCFIIVYSKTPVNADNALRIVGGNETTIEKHPWIVSIKSLGVHFCGGSIINENTIVTAAHCFAEISEGLSILAGTKNIDEKGTAIKVEYFIMHEKYDTETYTYDYDIAILKLSKNLTFSSKIQPILLPSEDTQVSVGEPVTIAGWGVTKEGSPIISNILRDVEIYSVDWETCKKELNDYGTVTENMFCAGYPTGNRDSCQCDSGGPLELNGTLLGIISWGNGCGEVGFPGVYTLVPKFRSWIKQHTGV
ncbi:unnamed protein product [Phyllotreta striolata]|uniref:Peptidase S1 domain-containing protein n=1 Tax=Phyllotreta striolata TaxID=444603 RepID=A0A9N9TK42_PHYSR|nr:unnamed protein product [Phyllotreta striolata]